MSREDRKLRKHLEERGKRERRRAKKYMAKHGDEALSRHTGPLATGLAAGLSGAILSFSALS